MAYRVDDYDGERILYLTCHDWQAEIVLSRGANLWRLRHASGLELLRTPPSVAVFREKTEMWGCPVLLPPNRIAAGRFEFNGRSYALPVNDRQGYSHIHGLLSRREWRLENVTADAVTMRFDNSPERDCFVWFPHQFTIRLTYRFEENSVIQNVELTNAGGEAMPFGFGFHTAFRLPFGDGGIEAAARCRVKATLADWQWEMDPEMQLPTGKQLSLPLGLDWQDGVIAEKNDVFLHAPIVTRDGFRGAVIESPADDFRVIYEVDEQFSYWVLWNYGGGQRFFCPEPQTWMIDAPNRSFSPERTGMRVLLPGEHWQAANRIILDRMT